MKSWVVLLNVKNLRGGSTLSNCRGAFINVIVHCEKKDIKSRLRQPMKDLELRILAFKGFREFNEVRHPNFAELEQKARTTGEPQIADTWYTY